MTAETVAVNSSLPRADVLAALRTASAKTGSDFAYLLATASRESSLNNEARSNVSSATGLFQFIDQTWLGLIKRFGGRHGLTAFSEAIAEQKDGSYTVAAPETKSAILALRCDPEISALMAGEAASQTKKALECVLGREVCGGELYAAHFLGLNGARELISLNESHPDSRADLEFPHAAKANRAVFYHADGTAKTVGEVYSSVVGTSGADVPQIVARNSSTRLLAENTNAPRTNKIASRESSVLNTIFACDTKFATRALPGPMFGDSTASLRSALPRAALKLSPSILDVLASFARVAPLSQGHART